MSKILAKQAIDLLKVTENEEQRIILEHIAKKNSPNTIANIIGFEPANVLHSLMFYFPVDGGEKSHYIDFLAEYFPEILCGTMFIPAEEATVFSGLVTWENIVQVLKRKLSNEQNFAGYFLNYYTLLIIEKNSQHVPTIDLGQILPAVAKNYCEQNKLDKDKFFNKFLGGFGRSIVFFIFGYGILYQVLYGSTHDQIAKDLQTAFGDSDFTDLASKTEPGLAAGEESRANAAVFIEQPPPTSPAKILERLSPDGLTITTGTTSPVVSTPPRLRPSVSNPLTPSPPNFALTRNASETKGESTLPTVNSQLAPEFSPVSEEFTFSPVKKKSLTFSPTKRDVPPSLGESRTTFYFTISGNNGSQEKRKKGDLPHVTPLQLQ